MSTSPQQPRVMVKTSSTLTFKGLLSIIYQRPKDADGFLSSLDPIVGKCARYELSICVGHLALCSNHAVIHLASDLFPCSFPLCLLCLFGFNMSFSSLLPSKNPSYLDRDGHFQHIWGLFICGLLRVEKSDRMKPALISDPF